MTAMANQEAAGPNHAARAQPQPARTRAGSRAAPRRLPSRYKMRILNEYEALDRRGKTTLLRREGLRASQLSRWRRRSVGTVHRNRCASRPAGTARTADQGFHPLPRRPHRSSPAAARARRIASTGRGQRSRRRPVLGFILGFILDSVLGPVLDTVLG